MLYVNVRINTTEVIFIYFGRLPDLILEAVIYTRGYSVCGVSGHWLGF